MISASQRRYGRGLSLLLLLPAGLLLAAAFLYPVGALVVDSLFDPGFTLENYGRALREPVFLAILLRTLRVAVIVTAVSLLLAYPVAFVLSRLSGWRAALLAACVVVPLWSSVLVRSYAWLVLLRGNGVVNSLLMDIGLVGQPLDLLYTELAVVIAMTQVLLPFMILPLYSSLRSVPDSLIRAARSLGAGHLSTFRIVVLPLSLPGVAAGCVFVFVLSLGFFITPALVGGPENLMIATLINDQVTQLQNLPFAAALATLLLLVTVALLAAFNRVLRLDRLVEGQR